MAEEGGSELRRETVGRRKGNGGGGGVDREGKRRLVNVR